MSNKITDKATSSTTPTNWFANIGGAVMQFTAAAFNSLIGSLLGPQTSAATSKETPVDADKLPLSDSAATNATKHLTWANLKAALQSVLTPAAHSADLITSGTIDVARLPYVASGVQVVSSGAIADLTSEQQAEVVKGAVVTTTDGRRWIYSGSGSKTSDASYIESADVTPAWAVIADKPSTFAPSAHASAHASGGGDAIKLDDLAAPDDNTDLDATTGAHGLMSKADKTKLDGVEAAADVTDATNVGAAIHGATEKTAPVNADKIALIDTEASNVLKWLSWTNVKATLKTYFDTLYSASTHTHAQSDITNLVSDLSGKAASSHTHALSALTQSGATSGQVAAWNGTAWAPATPSGGGSAISTPKVCYVQTDGNNGTAVVGNPALPFATSQAAFNAGVALAAPFSIHFGVGSHAGITVAADMSDVCGLTGEGFGVSVMSGINGLGADAGPAFDDDSPGNSGDPGKQLLFDSDGTIDVTSVQSSGGSATAGGANNMNGGTGGSAAPMRLRGVWGSGNCVALGRDGANGGGSGTNGSPGAGSSATLLRCMFGGTIEFGPGLGGSAGSARISQTVIGGTLSVNAPGFVTQCIAGGYSITTATESGNTTAGSAHLFA